MKIAVLWWLLPVADPEVLGNMGTKEAAPTIDYEALFFDVSRMLNVRILGTALMVIRQALPIPRHSSYNIA
jgi:hypothetical protein